jgi:hypothetical protein
VQADKSDVTMVLMGRGVAASANHMDSSVREDERICLTQQHVNDADIDKGKGAHDADEAQSKNRTEPQSASLGVGPTSRYLHEPVVSSGLSSMLRRRLFQTQDNCLALFG